MNEGLKRKLYDYEADPPEKMWEKIAASLEGEINAEFPQKLYNTEITPPGTTWNKIALGLDAVLIEEYPAKLYNLEVVPPAAVWQHISAKLEEEKALPKIAAKGKLIPFVRYAVAVCLIGLIAFAVKFLNSKTPEQNMIGKSIPANKNTPLEIVQPKKEKEQDIQPHTIATNNLPKESAYFNQNKSSRKRYEEQSATYMTEIADIPYSESRINEESFQNVNLQGNIPGKQSILADAAGRYLMFMNPDGFLIRMSKKLADALGCVYTNGNSEEYRQCQERIKKWRDKIAQSQVNPSQDNFLNILDLIKSLQDNEL